MFEILRKLMQAGATLDRNEELFTGETTYRCRVKGKLVSSLVLSNQDMTAPQFNEKIRIWAEELIPEVERIANEQAEGE